MSEDLFMLLDGLRRIRGRTKSLVLIEVQNLPANEGLVLDRIRNAKFVEIGRRGGRVVGDLGANSPLDLVEALLAIAQGPGVTGVFTLDLRRIAPEQ